MTHHTRNYAENYVLARVQRERTRHQATFNVKDHGSWEAAENAAGKWIREMHRTLPAPLSAKNRMTHRNSSGVVGVHPRTEHIQRPSGKEYEYYYWVSRWPGCKLKAGVKWPIHTYGEDDAFVLAVLCRRLETEIRDRVIAEFMDTVDASQYKQILALRRREA